MQCQNCNMEEMVKGTVPVAAQRGETSILVYKIPAWFAYMWILHPR